MRGIPLLNYPAFNAVASNLRASGYKVYNPAEDDLAAGSLADYMSIDLPEVCKADAVAVLPGWEDSEGARIEVDLARRLGKPVVDAKTMAPILVVNDLDLLLNLPDESVLDEAERLIHGERNDSYGDAREDFTRTGRLWAPILELETVTPHQVALCMAALKISREAFKPARDNAVDGCGYLALAHDIALADADRS